ncbi:MAG: flagellar hook-associated protein FlgK [Butyrivibrio sp.]|nr:flagellar hook-associated protein FlgK [Ruminococcus flavefaciens]MCM1560231.1 flagellar hook-associated protein FlgK [Butyrivibrio sp.]
MPLMGSLYIGSSGLQNSQNALNTTAHNLSNIDTVGYTRQQVQLSARSYVTLAVNPKAVNNKQTGLGVEYSRVKHIRDYFLDKTYRKESGRSMFYQVSTEVLEEVESQLGEMNGEAFQTTIEDFWTSIQELAKDPASSVTQGLLVQKASELVERASAVYEGLSSYQDNLNIQIRNQVEKINKYGKQILDLNDRIKAIEAGGIEQANDLRDARDQILDELAEMTSMSFKEDLYGAVSVQIEGVDFVKGGTCYEMALDVDPATGFYTPFWPFNATYRVLDDGTREYNIDGAEVFDLGVEISSDLNTDIGGVKAMLLARGDHRANYTDMDVNACSQYKLDKLELEDEEEYFENAESNGMKYYNNSVSQSVLMNVQAEFDQLIHNIVTKVNGILADAAGMQTVGGSKEGVSFTPTGGDTVEAKRTVKGVTSTEGPLADGDKFWIDEPGGYMRGKDGSPIQLIEKITTEGYRKVSGEVTYTYTYTDENGQEQTEDRTEKVDFWLYEEEEGPGTDSLYTISNLRINQELMQEPSMLGFRLEDGSEDIKTAEALKAAFTEEVYTLNPNVKKQTTFVDYYTDLVSQVGNSGQVYRSIYLNQETTVEEIESARQQVVGVSSDEELSNMIKFQNAYNAASRYINVVSEMLEHIINTLGM